MSSARHASDDEMDAATWCPSPGPQGSVDAFLADHRQQLFPPELLADVARLGGGHPSVPAEVIATVVVLQALEGLSDREAVSALRRDIAWKVACGLRLDDEGFHPTVLVYWRNRLRASARPRRVFDAIRQVVEATGVLAGRRRRVLDSTILADAVATEDTVTQLVAAIRRVRRLAPGARGVELSAWAREHLRELHHAQPAMPLEDRAADTWEPLIAIADLAQGDWPARARTAASVMTAAEAQQEEDTSASVRLLGDLCEVFDQADAEALYSATILDALHKLDEAPWADWHGHLLRPRELATLLRDYGVRPRDVREHGTGPQRKGYTRTDLHEPWTRYVPRHAQQPRHDDKPAAQPGREPVADRQAAAATSATAPRPVADVADPQPASATGLSSQNADVADVAHPPRSNGEPGSVWTRNGAPSPPPTPTRSPDPATPHHPPTGR